MYTHMHTHTGSAAAEVGILPGSCILKVRETDVLKASHEVVVNAIKGALSSTAGQEGGPCVSLKLSFSSLEQVTSFRYESSEDSSVVVHERTVESPYCFNVPAKVSLSWEDVYLKYGAVCIL